jgi:hypothetical protein
MSKKLKLAMVIVSALLITFLFHRKALGLNLILIEVLLFGYLFFTKQLTLKSTNAITCTVGVLATLLFTIITHSVFVYLMHFTALFIFTGVLIYPDIKSLLNACRLSLSNLFSAQYLFLKDLFSTRLKGQRLGSFIWKSRIFIIPVLIILLFVFIYRRSNPVFDELLSNIGLFIKEHLGNLFKYFDYLTIITFLIGLTISNLFFFKIIYPKIVDSDRSSGDGLQRVRAGKGRIFKLNSLKNEYKAGIFLLLILNGLILVVNFIDIYWVWFNFKWEGQYLKQFVHEGTYLLILSILISIALVLFFFRGNLNFYQKNKFLKYLSFIWLGQNAILTISVAIRNFYYIQYFALAYKRIGVLVFLLLTVFGLISVFIKVKSCRSAFYLFRTNAYAVFVTLVISSLINWDSYIARYNFSNARQSFLHLDYLATLSDKSLPYLDKNLEELKQIDAIQKEKYPFNEQFMLPDDYCHLIENRKVAFIGKWENKGFLEWNLAEYWAYKKIKEKK